LAQRLQTLLRAEGATVILTRSNNQSVGPCVNVRAATGPNADVAISIHGDGGPSSGHGFAVLTPVASPTNGAISAPSRRFGDDVVTAFQQVMPVSTYLGSHGVQPRSDLAGLNLSPIPKVFIECGNMRNNSDAALLKSPTWQQSAAVQLATAIRTYLLGGPQ
jgi:N-acetylmuramoyl-L-alanine amidase